MVGDYILNYLFKKHEFLSDHQRRKGRVEVRRKGEKGGHTSVCIQVCGPILIPNLKAQSLESACIVGGKIKVTG